MRVAAIVPALLCASLSASSCSSPEGGPLGFVMFDRNHHLAAAEPLFSIDEDQCMTASFLLSVFSGTGPVGKERPVCTQLRQQILAALPIGNLYAKKTPQLEKDERNEVIATLILASNKRCGDYVHFLQAYQGNVRMTSGLASQAFATLATLATGNTAQWLAAGSSFSTGAGSMTYNVHFADKTVAMLTQAFDNARLDRAQAIEDRMQCSEAQYPLPQAMADVFDYHTACSLTTGLMQAQDAVNQQRSPDLDTLVKLADQIDTARAALSKIGGKSGLAALMGGSPGAGHGNTGGGASSADAGTDNTAPASNSVGSAVPTTGTGGQSPPPQTHVPACPFTIAQNQQQVPKPTVNKDPSTKPKTKSARKNAKSAAKSRKTSSRATKKVTPKKTK